MPNLGVPGMPGMGDVQTSYWRRVCRSGTFGFLGQGKVLSRLLTRDCSNTGFELNPQAGLLIGRSTANTMLYGNSIVGPTLAALTDAGTSLTVAPNVATEIVRRFGNTGSFKLTGPPAAAGVVRTVTITYSAVNQVTGVVTITAAGINEVDTVTIGGTLASGSFAFMDRSTGATSRLVAFNAAVGAVQTALDDIFGAGNTVASGAVGATFTVTFAGTLIGTAMVMSDGSPRLGINNQLTNANSVSITRSTSGQDGSFIAGAFVQPADGTETMLTFLPDGFPLEMSDLNGNPVDIENPKIVTEGELDGSQLVYWPSDTSLRQYIIDQLDANGVGSFRFSEKY